MTPFTLTKSFPKEILGRALPGALGHRTEMTVSEVSPSYARASGGSDLNLRLTVSATGQLELALQDHSLAGLAGLKVNESVLLKFKG